jgi:hypothetical protein
MLPSHVTCTNIDGWSAVLAILPANMNISENLPIQYPRKDVNGASQPKSLRIYMLAQAFIADADGITVINLGRATPLRDLILVRISSKDDISFCTVCG